MIFLASLVLAILGAIVIGTLAGVAAGGSTVVTVAGAVAGAAVWARVVRALRRRLERPRAFRLQPVCGTCAACDGPLLMALDRSRAACPCGKTVITPAFMRPRDPAAVS